MAHSSDDLAVPAIRWIGLLPSEIQPFKLLTIPLSQPDQNRLKSLIKRPYLTENLYDELLVLKRNQCKAELESLAINGITYLINTYLREKIEKYTRKPRVLFG